jgi:hypothetical protein
VITAARRHALLLAAQELNNAAGCAYELATAEERRCREVRRAEAERIITDGEAALAEYVTGRAMLIHLEEELATSGGDLPPRLRWERYLYSKLRREVGEAEMRGFINRSLRLALPIVEARKVVARLLDNPPQPPLALLPAKPLAALKASSTGMGTV